MALSYKKKKFFKKEEERLEEILKRPDLTGEQAAATQRELTQVQTQLEKTPSTYTVTTKTGEKIQRTLIRDGREYHVVDTQAVTEEVPTEEVVTETKVETEEVPVRYELQSRRYEKARMLLEPWHEAEKKVLAGLEPGPGDPWFVQIGKGALRVPVSIGTGIGVAAATTGVMIGHLIEKPGEVLLGAETGALQIPELIPKKIEKLKKEFEERPLYVGGQALGYGITFLGPVVETGLRHGFIRPKLKPKIEVVSVKQPKVVKQITKGTAITEPKKLKTLTQLKSITKADQRYIISKSQLLQDMKGEVRGLTYGLEAVKPGKVRPFFAVETGIHVKTPLGTRTFQIPTVFKGTKTVTTPFMKPHALGPLTAPSGFKETKWVWKPEFPTVKSFAPKPTIVGTEDIIKIGKHEFIPLDVKGVSGGLVTTKESFFPTIQKYKIKHYTPVISSSGGLGGRAIVKPPRYTFTPSIPAGPTQQFLKVTAGPTFPHGATKFGSTFITGTGTGTQIISPKAPEVIKTLRKETISRTIFGIKAPTRTPTIQLVTPIVSLKQMVGPTTRQTITPLRVLRHKQIITPITTTKQIVTPMTATKLTTGLITTTTPGLVTTTINFLRPTTPGPPGVPIIPPPPLDFFGGRRRKQVMPRGYAYKPSLAAIVLGIRGKKPKVITGLEIRPIVKRKKKRKSWLF